MATKIKNFSINGKQDIGVFNLDHDPATMIDGLVIAQFSRWTSLMIAMDAEECRCEPGKSLLLPVVTAIQIEIETGIAKDDEGIFLLHLQVFAEALDGIEVSVFVSSEVDDIFWLEHFVELGEDDIGGDGWTRCRTGFTVYCLSARETIVRSVTPNPCFP